MEQCRLAIRVQPSSPQNQILRWADNVLYVKVAAPPIGGRANAELIDYLAKRLGLKKHQIAIVRGGTSRDKLLEIRGLTLEEVLGMLLSSAQA